MTKAKIISDISNISIRKLKKEVKKFSVEVVNVSPGNMNGGEYEVTFSGKKSDLISAYKDNAAVIAGSEVKTLNRNLKNIT